jgi:squalene synthase HpnC
MRPLPPPTPTLSFPAASAERAGGVGTLEPAPASSPSSPSSCSPGELDLSTLADRIPALAAARDIATAEEITRQLAHGHYENFSVVSMLVPRRLRQDFCNIYAFCRTADDLGDELGSRERAAAALNQFREQTHACFAGAADSALFAALQPTIRKHDLPIQPFLDLIDAFQQDQRVTRYDTFQQLADYCRRSANPVGRLVLLLFGYRDQQRFALSDLTCTALQLANFWQDVRRDYLDLDRIYLPRESMQKFGVTERQLGEQIRASRCDEPTRRLIEHEVHRTAELFDRGDALLPLLSAGVRAHVQLFAAGGRAVLNSIRRQNFDTLTRRPSLGKRQKAKLMVRALACTSMGTWLRGGGGGGAGRASAGANRKEIAAGAGDARA